MDVSQVVPQMEAHLGMDIATEEDYTSQSQLLKEFTDICNIDEAWIFKSRNGEGSKGMFSLSQPDLLANKMRKFILSAHISSETSNSMTFQWAPFPVEMENASITVPSPSGSKLLVVKNSENDSPTQFEIWGSSQLEKEFCVPQSVHGSVFTDDWFKGISWSHDESLIAYVAEEPAASKPNFDSSGYKKVNSNEKDCGSWKGQGDFEEEWGETYAGKKKPTLFVLNTKSGEVRAVRGIMSSLSAGQVIWAPSVRGANEYMVFVGWSSNLRKFGIKYYNNRPCAIYAVKNPFHQSEADKVDLKADAGEESPLCNLTQSISSAFFPRFSPDGKYLVFLSAKSGVDSGAHWDTNSLHKIDWLMDRNLSLHRSIADVVPIIMNAEEGCFPGLYCTNVLANPWLSDGCTMILTSSWRSSEVILAVNVLNGSVSRISPMESDASWEIFALDGDNVIAVSSSPVDVPQLKYGYLIDKTQSSSSWSWLDISSPISKCSKKVEMLLASRQFRLIKIPVEDVSTCTTRGATNDFEAIFVSSKSKNDVPDPLIVILHGGPHSVSTSSFSKSEAFLSSLGFSLLIVNYRGSLGFGEEALQSLPGKVGSQDVNDVLTAIDHTIEIGLANPSKIAVIGISHGGFLTTHLIGQAPDKFCAAAARNPVCNLALMVGTTDIPDWCYVVSYGIEGKNIFTEAPSDEHLSLLYSKSPISHVHKVKTPTLFLLGAQDLRVPVSNGLQYARALRERGVDCKVILFPHDVHAIKRPQSDFESFLNVGVWFKKYCK
ncbi:acylamino-acid-releasing enzyme-like [Rhodamnia argentea]|uniref:acylaminoacyl-peptidase n=1 Tax=Rhodamnia argentea TaxID=178133 RepID=A0A8B8Q4B7_9MYRT|nr:acylamino-acid-releasing enzyme-like [Rhodamnia argentea]